jgi:glycosyltransferase involved in cell wall biosynthesis
VSVVSISKDGRRPPAICLVTSRYPPGIGGVAVSSHRIAGYLAAAGYLVHVVATYPEAREVPRVERADEAGVIVHRVFFTPERADAQFFLRRFVRELDAAIDFDLFHGFFLTMVPACVHAASARADRPARPVIASARGSDAAWLMHHPILRQIMLGGLRRAAWLTALTRETLDELAPLVALDDRCSVMPAGAPPLGTPAWTLDDTNRGVVGTTGDFRPVKDVPLLIRSYAALPSSLRRRLILGGAFSHSQEEAWTQTLIAEFGLADEVEVTGRFTHDQAGDLLRRMHVYVLSSASEGMSNGLLEAAALGVPIVATAVGGARDVVVDGKNGLLVPHGEPEQLTNAIARVLTDPALARQLSQGGRALAASLSQERERAAWLALHARLLVGPAEAGPDL